MTLIKEDITKAFTHRVPVEGLRGVLTVDMQLVVDLSRHQPGWQVQGMRIGDLDPLPPFGEFRRLMLVGARRFVADLGKRGYLLHTAEADLRVFGPYHSRDWKRQRNGDLRAQGRTATEVLFDDSCDFLITGDFVATRVHLVELAARPSWAAALDAQMDGQSLEAKLRTPPEEAVRAALRH